MVLVLDFEQVGYSPEEKQRQLDGLLAGVKRLCEEKILEEEGVRDQFLEQVEATQQEIASLAAILGLEGNVAESTHLSDCSLTEQLAQLEGQLEKLRSDHKVLAATTACSHQYGMRSRLSRPLDMS